MHSPRPQAQHPNLHLDEVLPAAARFCSEVTDGATAPPVDESPEPTSTGGQTTTGSESQAPSATPTESEEEEEPAETGEPDAATILGSTGIVGFAALVLSFAILL